MDCKKAGEMTAGLLCGELSDGEKAELQAHLDGCVGCRKELELLSKSWQALDNFKVPALSLEFEDSLMSRIRAGRRKEEDAFFGFDLFGLSANARAALSGWWKVPALTLASCAVYVLSIETGLMPSRQYYPSAAARVQSAPNPIFAMLSEGQRTGGPGYVLALVEGADK